MNKLVEILAWIGNGIGKPPGWERVVRLVAPPEKCRAMPEFCAVRDGMVFHVQPAVPLGWHVAFFGTYEPELREIFRAVVPLGGVAVDVGANVGWHTLLMARLVGEGGLVIAAEPNPSVRIRLNENLKANRIAQVQVIPYAMSDAEGTAEFYGPEADESGSGDGHVVTPGSSGQSGNIQVETRSLDAIFAASQAVRLDLVKIDVEGYEWPVLLGAAQIIARFRPHIIFEYNAEYAVRGGGTPDLLEAFFQAHKYKLYAIGRSWADAVASRNWPRCADIWAVPLG